MEGRWGSSLHPGLKTPILRLPTSAPEVRQKVLRVDSQESSSPPNPNTKQANSDSPYMN